MQRLNAAMQYGMLKPMILRLPSPQSAHRWCERQRRAGMTIGYVPTMGAIHEGHSSLVRRAVRENDLVCASIFVNPLQFESSDDLAQYPQDFETDAKHLAQAGCDTVFVGELLAFFPEVQDPKNIRILDAGPAAQGLEGEFRPGHLDGVYSIVERLFTTVGDCHAYFGEKDFQQTLVVQHLARRLGFPQIVVCPTVREPNGLALSSRNSRLSDAERELATCVYRALGAAKEAWKNQVHDATALHETMIKSLTQPGVVIEYAEVRDPLDWQSTRPEGSLERAQALIAVRIAGVRLIDNLRLDAADDDLENDSALRVSATSEIKHRALTDT